MPSRAVLRQVALPSYFPFHHPVDFLPTLPKGSNDLNIFVCLLSVIPLPSPAPQTVGSRKGGTLSDPVQGVSLARAFQTLGAQYIVNE